MKSPNLWHGLLFLHGHVADPGLARSLASEPTPPGAPARSAPGVLGHVLYLGGRPMHAGHNYDVEEPFLEEVSGAEPRIERSPVRAQQGEAVARQPVAC